MAVNRTGDPSPPSRNAGSPRAGEALDDRGMLRETSEERVAFAELEVGEVEPGRDSAAESSSETCACKRPRNAARSAAGVTVAAIAAGCGATEAPKPEVIVAPPPRSLAPEG
jgi:hypothetical protein